MIAALLNLLRGLCDLLPVWPHPLNEIEPLEIIP